MVSASSLMKTSVWTSLAIQFLTFILTLRAVFISLPSEHRPLTDVMLIENIVQIVEALFYIIIAVNLARIQLDTVTPLRYVDWTITTPIMLISTIIYMEYRKRFRDGEKQLTLVEFFTTHKKVISTIVLANMGMLVFGFLGEVGVLPLYLSVSIGFVFFGLSFISFTPNSSTTFLQIDIYFYLCSVCGACTG